MTISGELLAGQREPRHVRRLIVIGIIVAFVIVAAIIGHAVSSSQSIAVGDCVKTTPIGVDNWSISKVACPASPNPLSLTQKVTEVLNGSNANCYNGIDATTFNDEPANKTYCLEPYLG